MKHSTVRLTDRCVFIAHTCVCAHYVARCTYTLGLKRTHVDSEQVCEHANVCVRIRFYLFIYYFFGKADVFFLIKIFFVGFYLFPRLFLSFFVNSFVLHKVLKTISCAWNHHTRKKERDDEEMRKKIRRNAANEETELRRPNERKKNSFINLCLATVTVIF